jgi:hypothetical protein
VLGVSPGHLLGAFWVPGVGPSQLLGALHVPRVSLPPPHSPPFRCLRGCPSIDVSLDVSGMIAQKNYIIMPECSIPSTPPGVSHAPQQKSVCLLDAASVPNQSGREQISKNLEGSRAATLSRATQEEDLS